MKIILPVLALISIGAAWWHGRRSALKAKSSNKFDFSRHYLTGINFLLNEETDKAVDLFVKMLEVDSETVETHLAVGKLFRRKGEVDRAIRIHQNLIARPQLDAAYRAQSLFELGQDYLSAGMLDRAEKIFLDLAQNTHHAESALKILMDIYQQEKDWIKAIDVAKKYEAVANQTMQAVIAHYYCELAEIAILQQETNQAISYLQQAISADAACVRASLLQAKRLMGNGQYKEALVHLKQIQSQNPHYLSEAIDLLAQCYEALHCEDELVQYLKKLLETYPHVPVVIILAERIRKWRGDMVAIQFVADYVRRYPSLRGLSLLINLYIANVEGRVKDDLFILQNLMKKLLDKKLEYQCTSCGFPGKSLHWQCPGCKRWGTVLLINTEE